MHWEARFLSSCFRTVIWSIQTTADVFMGCCGCTWRNMKFKLAVLDIFFLNIQNRLEIRKLLPPSARRSSNSVFQQCSCSYCFFHMLTQRQEWEEITAASTEAWMTILKKYVLIFWSETLLFVVPSLHHSCQPSCAMVWFRKSARDNKGNMLSSCWLSRSSK